MLVLLTVDKGVKPSAFVTRVSVIPVINPSSFVNSDIAAGIDVLPGRKLPAPVPATGIVGLLVKLSKSPSNRVGRLAKLP